MLLLKTIKDKTNNSLPIWIMRQAGRHLPEYQALKKKTGSLDKMFMDPVVATEALNAVVLFKDFYDGRYPVTRDDFHPKTMGADVSITESLLEINHQMKKEIMNHEVLIKDAGKVFQ